MRNSISILVAFAAILYNVETKAQSGYDAGAIQEQDLDGTARYVSMGGALGALGADISTMGDNPAGTAIMRQADASITFGAQFTGNRGEVGKNRARPSLNQAGVVFVFGKNDTGVRNFNFGVNYRQSRSYLENTSASFNYAGRGSQLYQLANMSNQCYADMINAYSSLDDRRRKDFDYIESWGLLPDYFGDITGWGSAKDSYNYMKNNIQYGSLDMRENLVFASPAQSGDYRRTAWGTNSQVDISFSLNCNDRVFIGASVGIYTSSLDRRSVYTEDFTSGAYYTLSNYYRSKATGADGKLGVIVRPFESSPFRVGFTVHTPIWYNVTDRNGFTLESRDGDSYYNKGYDTEDFVCNFRTPWVIGASIGHTFGTQVAIGAEYEFRDCGSSRYSSRQSDGFDMGTSNSMVRNTLKAQHTIKAGIEVKPIKYLALRLGYNFVTSPYKTDAYYSLPFYSNYTETDYTNWGNIHRITAGIGFKISRFYIDMAYQHQMQKGDFYPYYNPFPDNVIPESAYGAKYYVVEGPNLVAPTSISRNRGQFTATLGVRF